MIRSILRWLNAPLYKSVSNAEPFVDPTFGACRYCPDINAWITDWQDPHNRKVEIMGRSIRPTPDQAALWRQARERLPQLLQEASASIPEPLVKDFTPAVITREGVELAEIRFEKDGTVQFFLDFKISEPQGYEMWPVIVFKNWQIVRSEWCV